MDEGGKDPSSECGGEKWFAAVVVGPRAGKQDEEGGGHGTQESINQVRQAEKSDKEISMDQCVTYSSQQKDYRYEMHGLVGSKAKFEL